LIEFLSALATIFAAKKDGFLPRFLPAYWKKT